MIGEGEGEEELPVAENYSTTENSLGPTHGASHRPVTPELDKERFSTAAELNRTPGTALQPRPSPGQP